MGCEEVDQLSRRKSTIFHTGEDFVDAVLRFRDSTIVSREGSIRTADQELKARGTCAVGDTNSASELDEIAGSDEMLLKKRREGVDRVVDTVVRREVGLDLAEDDHRAISSCALEGSRLGKTDGVVEGETEGLVDVLTALAVEDFLQIVAEREERTAL